MSTEHSSYTIDELALCKLIAHELSEGPHSVEEIYGMLILILRLKDKQSQIALAPFVQEQMAKVDHLYEPMRATQGVARPFTDYSTLPNPPLGG